MTSCAAWPTWCCTASPGSTTCRPPAWRPRSSWSAYYADLVAERRRRPADDLTSALVAAELDGRRLSDDDIIAFLFLMVVAGNETTTKLLGHAWYWAWRNPDQRAVPFADPGRIPDWVEETLRYDTSTQFLVRTATEDIPLHGGVVPAGSGSCCCSGRPAVTRGPTPIPTGTTSTGPRTPSSPASASAATSASGRRWPGSRPGSRSRSWWPASPTTTSTRTEAERVHSANVRGFARLPTSVTRR